MCGYMAVYFLMNDCGSKMEKSKFAIQRVCRLLLRTKCERTERNRRCGWHTQFTEFIKGWIKVLNFLALEIIRDILMSQTVSNLDKLPIFNRFSSWRPTVKNLPEITHWELKSWNLFKWATSFILYFILCTSYYVLHLCFICCDVHNESSWPLMDLIGNIREYPDIDYIHWSL